MQYAGKRVRRPIIIHSPIRIFSPRVYNEIVNRRVIVGIVVLLLLAVAVGMFLRTRSTTPPESIPLVQEEVTGAPAAAVPEEGSAEEILVETANPYTEALDAANPFKDAYRNPFE